MIHVGDCREVMAGMEPESVDAIVTDPPYGLEFMGKEWDRPWAVSAANGVGYAGRHDLKLPSHRDNRNANCRACGGRQRGKKRCSCAVPDWDRDPRSDMQAFQEWTQTWAREAFRVLKPGGHMLAFGGTRTFHRMTVAIEDAGFEIRDCLSYLYGSGFPKSHNLDRVAGFCRCSAVPYSHDNDHVPSLSEAISGVPSDDSPQQDSDLFPAMQRETPGRGMGDARAQGPGSVDGCQPGELPGEDDRPEQSGMEGRGDLLQDARQLHGHEVRSVPGTLPGDGESGRLRDGASAHHGEHGGLLPDSGRGGASHRPRSSEQRPDEPRIVAEQRGAQAMGAWPNCSRCGLPRIPKGLGTALKPAWEPVIVARKPLVGTVAANVLQHGTGALNIDATRIRTDDDRGRPRGTFPHSDDAWGNGHLDRTESNPLGRWPANVVLDEAAAEMLDQMSGERKTSNQSTAGVPRQRGNGWGNTYDGPHYGDTGGASRFFYTAKASRAERNAGLDGMPELDTTALYGQGVGLSGRTMIDGEWVNTDAPRKPKANVHPTVKPIALMRWLVRLVTPPGGLILDPFAGSGSTGCAAALEGFRFVGIEQDAEYAEIAERRIAYWAAQRPTVLQPALPLEGAAD